MQISEHANIVADGIDRDLNLCRGDKELIAERIQSAIDADRAERPLAIQKTSETPFPAEWLDGDGFLVGVATNHGLEWHVIHARDNGFNDTHGDDWSCWSIEDVSYWAKLPTLREMEGAAS